MYGLLFESCKNADTLYGAVQELNSCVAVTMRPSAYRPTPHQIAQHFAHSSLRTLTTFSANWRIPGRAGRYSVE